MLDIHDILSLSGIKCCQESLSVSTLTGGTSNIIYHVKISTGLQLLFRVYGSGSEKLIDRSQELETMKLLEKYGLCASVLAQFENGIVCHYINGTSISKSTILTQKMTHLVATKLAKIHQIPIENKQDILWSTLWNFIGLVPEFEDNSNGNFKRKEDLVTEYSFLKTMLEDCKSPLVFCHMDLNLPNILYDGSDVHFIDFEYSGCSYAAYDIANHFIEFVVLDEQQNLDYIKWYPSKEYQLSWIRIYLAAMPDPWSEEDVLAIFDLVQKFVLCSHLMWAAWSLVQVTISTIDFDFHNFAQQRLKEYSRMKNIVIAN